MADTFANYVLGMKPERETDIISFIVTRSLLNT